MSCRLRDLIKSVRQCKTAAAEREVIAKESAALRKAFKEQDGRYRHRNVAKLLFMHMLGYPTHFGQMETLKLVASNSFGDKRIGYLGLMLLLDERQEVLMLVTNSLKNDLNSTDQYVIGLALTALGNICSAEMARDLSPEVDRLLSSGNPYLRKKAALCARRMIHRCPDLMEPFAERAIQQLNERNHAVVLTGVTLMIDIVTREKERVFRAVFAQCVPLLCRVLKVLVSGGFAAEYDVSGVSDPYLQVKILQLLRLLSEGDAQVGDSISDILAQVATNIDSGGKGAGNAVLYECVRTIMSVRGNSGLRVLAVNILGRFLGYRDNNMKYVSLSLMQTTLSEDPQALNRHRTVILECVKDSDDSIRRKALDLVMLLSLSNKESATDIVRELIAELRVCDRSFKKELGDRICVLILKALENGSEKGSEKGSNATTKWYIDTMLVVLTLVGTVTEDACRALMTVVLNSGGASGYAAYACDTYFEKWEETWDLLSSGASQYDASYASYASLTQVTLWMCGEFALRKKGAGDENEITLGDFDSPIDETKLLGMIDRILTSDGVDDKIKAYALTTLAKLYPRCSVASNRELIRKMLRSLDADVDLEIQTRSVEYSLVCGSATNNAINNNYTTNNASGSIPETVFAAMPKLVMDGGQLDLDAETEKEKEKEGGLDGGLDLTALLSLDEDHLDHADAVPVAAAKKYGSQTPAFEDAYLRLFVEDVTVAADDNNNNNNNIIGPSVRFTARYEAVSSGPLRAFRVQAAVPKQMKLRLDPPTGTVLSASEGLFVTQRMSIESVASDESKNMSNGEYLAMKVRLNFEVGGEKVIQVAEIRVPLRKWLQ